MRNFRWSRDPYLGYEIVAESIILNDKSLFKVGYIGSDSSNLDGEICSQQCPPDYNL